MKQRAIVTLDRHVRQVCEVIMDEDRFVEEVIAVIDDNYDDETFEVINIRTVLSKWD